ncbi:DUF485 domain-containing protein [Mycobacterium sp. Aquia_213]|nr:DUF485 domain-containing protein [Mycobacterium sp. Aquia_213]WAC91305.1 DUF485 domain-containing protein [Mycobacterium sp. Aquia_213]
MSQPTTGSQQQRGPTPPIAPLQASSNGHSASNSTPAGLDAGPGEERHAPNLDDFVRMQATPEFQDLRHRLRRFVFPMTAFFLIWYLAYMLLATYAHALMATKVLGHINLGVVLGFGQFVTTFGITALYVRFAARTLDPRAAKIRADFEGAGA